MSSEAFYRELLEGALRAFPPYPEGRHAGRGIVLCAGGLSYLANAFVSMRLLRERTGLPIELFHAGGAEMPAEARAMLESDFAPIVVRDISGPDLNGDPALRMEPPLLGVHEFLGVRSFRGYQIKPWAILHSAFEEVLLLDADNMPLQPLEPLFASAEYASTGALFWHDATSLRTTSDELFRVFGLDPGAARVSSEFESGQILVDKRRCWKALLAVCLANSDVEGFREYCYRHTLGDKDTFRLAFAFAAQPCAVVPHAPWHVGIPFLFIPIPLARRRLWIQHDLGSRITTGALQHDPSGSPLFIHKTVCPWDLYLDYRYLRDAESPDGALHPLPLLRECEERGLRYLEEFRRRYLPCFGRSRVMELQRLGAKAIQRILDGVLYLRRLRDRPRR